MKNYKTNLIAIIKDSDVGYVDNKMTNPLIRHASRGIVFNDFSEIAVFNKRNKNEYKLPGGGRESNETPTETFTREILEETGCEVKDVTELGIIEEYKTQNNFKQISSVFIAKCKNDTNQLNLTEKEKDEGGQLLWMPLEEALQKMRDCLNFIIPSKYESVYITKFIVYRDIKIIEYYLKHQKQILK